MSRYAGNLVVGRGRCNGFLVDRSSLVETQDSVSEEMKRSGAPRRFDELAAEIGEAMNPKGEQIRMATRDDKELLGLVERLSDAIERLTRVIENKSESTDTKHKVADSKPANSGQRQAAEFEGMARNFHRRDLKAVFSERALQVPVTRAQDGTEGGFLDACMKRRTELLR